MTQFCVTGEPRGKGRPRFSRAGHAYTDDRTRAYEQLVREAYSTSAAAHDPCGALQVSILAVLPIAKRDSKRMRNDKLTGVTPAVRKPDVDNIAKVILDALNGFAWMDDKQITQLDVRKTYGMDARVIVTIADAVRQEVRR